MTLHEQAPHDQAPPARPARTFDNEAGLPRVPLPTVDDSGRRFLEWCAPLLTADELAATEAAVDALRAPGNPAHVLQAALERYDARPEVASWLDAFWASRYLGRRDRIALNANFFFLFDDAGDDQVARAAGLIVAALDHKRQLDEERVPPVVQRGRAMTMEQNKLLFSATRIPGAEQDTVRAPYSDEWPGPSPFRHVVVFYRGNAFRMDVLAPGSSDGAPGAPYSPADLAAGLEAVMHAGRDRAADGTSPGHLTTKARAEWAASRQRLRALDPANAAALETIETALFCVCLEDTAPEDTLEACDLLLHGDSANRWFDKAVSFVVFADGTAGINCEHCGLDGTTILYLVDAIFGASTAAHAERAGAVAPGEPAVEPIGLVLDAEMRADIRAAGRAFADFAAANASTVLSLDVGSDRAKQLGVSPDAFAQMAYQLAHRRAKGLTGATYESIATRQYRNGRTEAMRVVTPEVVRFVEAMEDPAADRAARATAFRAAADAHVRRSRECQAGDAPEQHLWELQLIQERRGDELGVGLDQVGPLAIYDSPGWRIMRDDHLSTSSAPSVNIRHFGFGATSDRCIGIAYALLPDRLNIYLSTPRAVADRMHRFAAEVPRALDEIQALLEP
jgi:carnitine O-acetyltransferase